MSFPLLLAATLSLAPAPSGKLEISNVLPAYGELGPSRPGWKVPLADTLHVAFDIEGLRIDPKGLVRYRTALEVENSKGESIYKPDPLETALLHIQGGGKVRHGVVIVTGLDQSPGKYLMKVTVSDLVKADDKREASFTQEFTLLPADFNLVRFQMAYDRLGNIPAPCAGSVGQTMFVTAVVLGFKPDVKNENQASFRVEMRILDAQDKPTSAKPAVTEAKVIPAGINHVPIRFTLPLTRAGQYKLALKATDPVGNKTARLSVPLLVVDVK